MKRVTGIGGVFFKATDAPALQAWYKRHLGIDVQAWGGTAFTAPFMINYRVQDLHALVRALRDATEISVHERKKRAAAAVISDARPDTTKEIPMPIVLDRLLAPNALAARIFNLLQPVAALAARWYVSRQFLKSGYLKTLSWDSTLYLFENEYHTPLLPPHVAAYAGTCGELFFPTLLVLGFSSRLGAVGLLLVNAMAVLSYTQVLLAPGSEAALGQHVLWGSILVFLCVYGPGILSVDYLLSRGRTATI